MKVKGKVEYMDAQPIVWGAEARFRAAVTRLTAALEALAARPAPAPKPKPLRPLGEIRAEAARMMDARLRQVMAAQGVDYPRALAYMQEHEPEALESYAAIRRR